MERSEFYKEVLEEVGAIDAHDSVSGADEAKVSKALDRVVAGLQSRSVTQLNVGTTIDDAISNPLIILVAYQVGPAFGYGRNEDAKLRAEAEILNATNTAYRSKPVRRSTFL